VNKSGEKGIYTYIERETKRKKRKEGDVEQLYIEKSFNSLL